MGENEPRGPVPRAALTGLGAVAVVFAGLYASAYAVTSADVPRGTTVLGVQIGGLSEREARARLARELPRLLPETIRLTAGTRSFRVDSSDAGLAVDIRETVERAGHRKLSPFELVPKLFGATDRYLPVLAVDEAKLAAAVARVGGSVDRLGRDGGITFADGRATATTPRAGRALDRGAAATALSDAYAHALAAATAPVRVIAPPVSAEVIEATMRSFAEPAMSGPVTMQAGKQAVELTPQQIGSYLTLVPEAGVLKPVFDGAALIEELAEKHDNLGKPAKDASFKIEDDRPVIVPSRPGRAFDPAGLATALLAVLPSTTDRTIAPQLTESEPKFSTADAEALGIREKISSFRTEYPIAPYRITNIGRAAELMNGSLVKPGKIWSLNSTVGERTPANGFVKGFIIREGNFKEEQGGGVSQSATTLFNAVFFAGLKDVEHHPHSLYISRYPAGREATVAFGEKDLRFQNDSPYGVYIQAVHSPGFIEVTFWGTKVYDKIESVSSDRYNVVAPGAKVSTAEDCEEQKPADGFDIDVTRVFWQDGKVVQQEKFHTHYDPTDKITCAPPGSTPTPEPSSRPTEASTTPTASPKPSSIQPSSTQPSSTRPTGTPKPSRSSPAPTSGSAGEPDDEVPSAAPAPPVEPEISLPVLVPGPAPDGDGDTGQT